MGQDGMVAENSGVHLVTCSQLCVPLVSVSSGWAAGNSYQPSLLLWETLQEQQMQVSAGIMRLADQNWELGLQNPYYFIETF